MVLRILITGAEGQLGKAIIKQWAAEDSLFAYNSIDCNVLDKNKVLEIFLKILPDVVVHCAAYTAVDKAETEIVKCKAVNIQGSINVAEACRRIGSKLVFISSDYVFDGEKKGQYEITDEVRPLNMYGLTKAVAEKEVKAINLKTFIVRTSWMFGEGKNFVNTMLELAKTSGMIPVVKDQIGSPTYAVDLANFLYQLIRTEKYGIYHATNEGFCSWAELAQRIFILKGVDVRVVPVTSEEYGAKAKRPKNSMLSKASLDHNGFLRFPTWEESLEEYLKSKFEK